jgi:hypothetical protein
VRSCSSMKALRPSIRLIDVLLIQCVHSTACAGVMIVRWCKGLVPAGYRRSSGRERNRSQLRSHGGEPREVVTDKLRSYGVAHRELMPDVIHDNSQYANSRAEQTHEATRVRDRGMRGPASRRFKSVRQAQRLLGAHAAVSNLFNPGRHLIRAEHYRNLREGAFDEWSRAVV